MGFLKYFRHRRVNSGDVLMVVESDKADMDVEAFEEGKSIHVLNFILRMCICSIHIHRHVCVCVCVCVCIFSSKYGR